MSVDRHLRRDVVPDHAVGKRFDRVATELFPEFSRSQLTAWIRSGDLVIDGRPAKPSFRLLGGEDLVLDAEVAQRAGWHLAQSVSFEVVFEDEDVLVVDKPAGLVVHPGAGNPDRTLVNGLLAYRSSLAALPRAGIVHRLDKDTSGLMVVAASDRGLTELAKAMSAYKIDRQYMAIIEGVMVSGRDIDLAIARDPNQRTRQRVREDGREALTHVSVRERYRAHTFVVAKLETGRTHQVRVHMSAIGHPLVGDKRYGARGLLPKQPSETLVDTIRGFSRQALHSWTLRFAHPLTEQLLSFECAPPADISHLMSALRDDVGRGV